LSVKAAIHEGRQQGKEEALMAFLKALNISGSGLTAQRLRLDIVSENITNMDTTRTENGDGPYRRKVVQFQAVNEGNFRAALGRAVNRHINRNLDWEFDDRRLSYRRNSLLDAGNVRDGGVIVSEIIDDETPFKTVWDPTHPDADEFGYVLLPNVELIKEVVDAMSASRSYEANITAINAVKLMASKALEIGR